jgi:alkylation response protein AidB-like acyl-CoA dehydrogenase
MTDSCNRRTLDEEARRIVAAASAFRPELRRRAEEIENARVLPQDISDRFAEAGFFRTCVPAEYGGLELPPVATSRMIEELARGDGSAAWCAFIGATTGTVLALVPEATARTVFATPTTRICGTFAPMGEARADGDGYLVRGQWAWGSGTQNADWIVAGCRLFGADAEPETDERGNPRQHMVLVPAGDVGFLDTWHTSGLAGTGSTDFRLSDVHVPAERVVGLMTPAPPDRPLYAFPQFGLLAQGIAAVTLGLARAAIDELVDLAGGKKPQGSRRSLAERTSTQYDVAEAEALLRSARAFYYESIEAAWEEASCSGKISVTLRRDIRLATSHAVRSSARAVDLMYELGGGTSVYKRSPLQRIFRDVHVATAHMMVARPVMEVVGRLVLGLETDTRQL